eukprot:m.1299 g.1299  ORF g.1299 m.1299 type:complete len:299 (+) comp2023_c0_seq1:65-961(+)
MAAAKYVDKLCEKLDSVYQKQIETLSINSDLHLTWLKEIVPVVRQALLDSTNDQPQLMPKTPSHKSRPKRIKIDSASEDEADELSPVPSNRRMTRSRASIQPLSAAHEELTNKASDGRQGTRHTKRPSKKSLSKSKRPRSQSSSPATSPCSMDDVVADDELSDAVIVEPDDDADMTATSNIAATPQEAATPEAIDTDHLFAKPSTPAYMSPARGVSTRQVATPSTVVKNGQFTPRSVKKRPVRTPRQTPIASAVKVKAMVAQMQQSTPTAAVPAGKRASPEVGEGLPPPKMAAVRKRV